MEIVLNGDPDHPQPALTKEIVSEAARDGLILLSCGIRGNVIRFLPALTASDEIIEEGLDVLVKVISRKASSHAELDPRAICPLPAGRQNLGTRSRVEAK